MPFTNEQVCLSLQNAIFGIISKQCPLTQLLNYFIIVGKLFLWDCRRNQIKPTIKFYQNKIANKYETEHKIKKNNDFENNGCHRDSGISHTFLQKFWAKNRGCSLYTRPFFSEKVNWLVLSQI